MATKCPECHSPEAHKLSCSRGKHFRYAGFRTTDGPVPVADIATGADKCGPASHDGGCDSSGF